MFRYSLLLFIDMVSIIVRLGTLYMIVHFPDLQLYFGTKEA